MSNIALYLMLPSLRLRRLRAVLITAGIAIGIALYIAISIINSSTLKAFRASVEAVAGKTQLSISAGDAGFPEEKLEVAQNTPGVKSAIPLIISRGYFTGDQARTTLQILGVDLLKEQNVRSYKTKDEEVIDDPLVFLNQADSIILTHEFATAHHLTSDSPINLATTKGAQRFVVRGLLTPDGPAKAFGGAIAIMDIDGARRMFGKEGKLDRIDIVTRADADLDQVKHALESRFGTGYSVDRPDSQSAEMENMVSSFQAMLGLFSSLALLIGVFMVFNLVGISVAERRREIGMLRALGATRFQILSLFVSEAFLFGSIGSTAGALLGWLLSYSLVGQITATLATQFVIQVEVPKIIFTPADFISGVVLGCAAAILAAIWPSWKATQITPVEAFAPRGIDQKKGKTSSPLNLWTSAGALLFLSSVLATRLFHDSIPSKFQTMLLVTSFLGAILAGPTFVLFSLEKFLPWFQSLFEPSMVSRLSTANIFDQRKRTASNLSVLLIGLSFVVLISTVETSFKLTATNWIDKQLTHDIIVSSNGKLISFDTQLIDEQIAKEIATLPQVLKINEKGYYPTRFIRLKYKGQQLGLKAIEPPDTRLHYSQFDLRGGEPEAVFQQLFSMNAPAGILVSSNFVDHFQARVGDIISIATPSGDKNFKILGIITDLANPLGVFYVDRKIYQEYWHDNLINAFGIYAAEGVAPKDLKAAIEAKVGPEKNLLIALNKDLKKDMRDVIDQSFAFIGAIEIAAMIVTLFGILNTVLVSVLERTREFGLLRAVGMTRAQLFQMILSEVLIQGSLGALAAILLGSILSFIWVQYSLSAVLGWRVEFYFPWIEVFKTFVLGILVALIAGLWPARKASDLTVSEALGYE